MDINKVEIPEHEVGPLFESVKREVGWYSIGLVQLKRDKLNEEVILIGSGTLIKIGGIYGILTAQHVTAELNDEFGLIISNHEQRYILKKKHLHIIKVAKPSEPSKGPDLAVIVLPDKLLGTLKAKKSFYSLSQKSEKMLKELLDYGGWVLFGYCDELTTDEGSDRGFISTKGFRALCYGTQVKKNYTRGEYDFLELVALYKESSKALPSSFGGMSGGGLWQILFMQSEDGKIQIKEPILSGVAFYQTEKEDDIRYIVCHGRHSIYHKVYEVVRKEFT